MGAVARKCMSEEVGMLRLVMNVAALDLSALVRLWVFPRGDGPVSALMSRGDPRGQRLAAESFHHRSLTRLSPGRVYNCEGTGHVSGNSNLWTIDGAGQGGLRLELCDIDEGMFCGFGKMLCSAWDTAAPMHENMLLYCIGV